LEKSKNKTGKAEQ